MRVPAQWLREYADVPVGASPEELHAALVRVGLEEEDVHRMEISGPVVVGRVMDFVDEPQKNGKTIRWCQVDVGESEPRGIVCGAHNFFVGDKVVVSLPGALLPGPFPISARSTYGHVSDGMIASARELGLGDEHAGILRLEEFGLDPEPGTDAIALLGLDDFAVEVNVTPDRGYAFSIRGIAREYAHATGAGFRDPAFDERLTADVRAWTAARATAPEFPVTIADQAPIRGRIGASVFVTRVVRDLDPGKPTPAWMVTRLALAGVRSISLVVDVTNYVMLELGQPIHAYDLDRLSGGITVRRAEEGETLVTLDGKERTLLTEDLLITDEAGPIGLAGVMGGASTEVGDDTRAVLIEAANFDPVSIARTARRHRLPSEASRRFERGVDPLVAEVAAARVSQLLVRLGGGTADVLGSSLVDYASPEPIELPSGYAARLVGVDYAEHEVSGALVEIGASLEAVDGGLRVTPPSWRPDLTDKATLVEEVARIVGYERVPSVLPVAPPGRGLTRSQRLRRGVAQALAAGGATEVLAYPFVSVATHERFEGDVAAVRLANPLDAEVPLLRRSLIPGLVDIGRRNLSRGLTDLSLFEIGAVFQPSPAAPFGSAILPPGAARPSDEVLAELNSGIPAQPWHVGGLVVGEAIAKQPGQPAVAASLADVLDAARQVSAALAVDIRPRTGSHPALHPGRTAELVVGDRVVGVAGELLPALAAELDLPRVVAVYDLDLSALIELAATEVAPTAIVSYPAATQDLSLVVADSVLAGEVLDAVIEGSGPLLEHASLVDDYRGTGVPEGGKSLTFALRFRAPDRTLTAAEASEAKLAGVALAAERFGASLRE